MRPPPNWICDGTIVIEESMESCFDLDCCGCGHVVDCLAPRRCTHTILYCNVCIIAFPTFPLDYHVDQASEYESRCRAKSLQQLPGFAYIICQRTVVHTH